MDSELKPYKLGGHCPASEEEPLNQTIQGYMTHGWTCCQIFLGPDDNVAERRALTKEDSKLCVKLSGRGNVAFRVYTHYPYRANLVKPMSKGYLGGIQSELDTLAPFRGRIVIHPNSAGGPANKDNVKVEGTGYVASYKAAIKVMMSNLGKLKFAHDYSLLLEGPAGEGSKIGWSFQQLEYIAKQLKKHGLEKTVGFCMDTCHNFCAGLSRFDTLKAVEKYFRKLDNIGVLKHVKAVHLNDSREDYKALKDRHELLCLGKIWKDKEVGFMAFLDHCTKLNIDIICETGAHQGVPLCLETLRIASTFSEDSTSS
jgi:endonuclease IV